MARHMLDLGDLVKVYRPGERDEHIYQDKKEPSIGLLVKWLSIRKVLVLMSDNTLEQKYTADLEKLSG